ncbi:hypothetical protein [Pseudomonas savastanoi]|nr:hypothetical protein [Pseudomonas savastanoi]UKL12732.1 hypothetical protein HQ966_14995 [Pseudomonas savastanoi pv. savastanoi]
MDFPSCGFDAGLTLHHGTSMPIRDFRRALWTGKSLSFAMDDVTLITRANFQEVLTKIGLWK